MAARTTRSQRQRLLAQLATHAFHSTPILTFFTGTELAHFQRVARETRDAASTPPLWLALCQAEAATDSGLIHCLLRGGGGDVTQMTQQLYGRLRNLNADLRDGERRSATSPLVPQAWHNPSLRDTIQYSAAPFDDSTFEILLRCTQGERVVLDATVKQTVRRDAVLGESDDRVLLCSWQPVWMYNWEPDEKWQPDDAPSFEDTVTNCGYAESPPNPPVDITIMLRRLSDRKVATLLSTSTEEGPRAIGDCMSTVGDPQFDWVTWHHTKEKIDDIEYKFSTVIDIRFPAGEEGVGNMPPVPHPAAENERFCVGNICRIDFECEEMASEVDDLCGAYEAMRRLVFGNGALQWR